jgi:hypothetical protein
VAVSPTERLRRKYKPARITLLFVGESAPAGGTFFYAQNSTLYREVRAAFETALPEVFGRRDDFLETFRALGCYLDDLCLEPVNNLPRRERREARTRAEPALARRLRRYRPQRVVAIGKTTTGPHARLALAGAGLGDVAFNVISFPGRPEHKADFHRELRTILRSAGKSGLLVP